MRRPWTKTSASQHAAFQRCQRYWFFGWIDRLSRPTSEAMQRGTNIHAEVEHYLKTGEMRESSYEGQDYAPYVEALRPHLPEPFGFDWMVTEHPIEINLGEGMPAWVGFIDVAYLAKKPRPILKIHDVKTTSDFRYAKTSEELRQNIQVISYARWAYEEDLRHDVEVGHIYVKTRPKVPKNPATKFVSTIVDEKHVAEVWEREMEVVREMQVAATASAAEDLSPTISACGMYGGCPFRSNCGLVRVSFADLQPRGDKQMSDFMSRLKNKQNKQKEAGVLPPDAPSRETPVVEKQESEQPPEKKKQAVKKRASKKQKVLAHNETPCEETDSDVERAIAKQSSNGFTLYIDCMPMKGSGRYVLFEDWFALVTSELNEQVKEEFGESTYLLLPFSQEKALLLDAVDRAALVLKADMVVQSGSIGAKDALTALIPHARVVVRALR